MPRSLPALLLALVPSAAAAQNGPVVDPDPEIERKSFLVAPGFEVNLFAADPLLAKPIQINFDPQGRLWVASSEVYPQIKPGEKANDKIIVLEDTTGTGKADKTTVFADGLLIPTGVEPGDGGAYVANSTELVHLSASEPGGKADRKRILLSGFGTEDTHHIIHTFRWGPDCCLYFNQSIYIHSHIETPHGVKRLNAGGIWRYRPDTHELDVFARGWINSWGHAFDRWGQSFATDGANGEGINHVIPGGYYPAAQGPHVQRILHGLNPGSPKHCGLEIVSGRHLPDDWQGDCITCDFRGHRVCRFKLSDDGSTFASREMPEVIKSAHPAFRPIDVKMGPDGAIYIADWYNPIIQHGEVDFRDPRRDKTHGRIWRVTAKNRPLVASPKLVSATIPELLEQLKSPEGWTRHQAKRVLKERGADKVLPVLKEWASKEWKAEGHPNDQLLVELAWVEHAARPTDRGVVCSPLLARHASGRAAATRLASQLAYRDALAHAVRDREPRVRLEAVRGLAGLRTAIAVEIAMGVLDQPVDRAIDYALWLTVRELEPYWMPEFKAGKLTFDGDAKKLAFALNAVGTKDAVKPVVALIESGKVAKENEHGLYLLLARIGGPAELGRVAERAAAEQDLLKGQRAELAQAVEDSVRLRKVGRPADLGKFRLLLMSPERPARLSGARLVGLWKVEQLRKNLEATGRLPEDATAEEAAAALEGIALFGDDKAKAFLAELCGPESKPEVRRSAVAALAGLDTPAAAIKAAQLLTAAEPAESLTEVFAAFLNRKGGSAILAKALAGKTLPPDVAKLGLRAVRASVAQDAKSLTDALTKAGGLAAAKKEPTADEVKALVAEVTSTGDAARGEAVYRRKELQCLACHGTGGAGGQVGPDLTSVGASAPVDYLVESILIPNKAVKEGFHALRVVTVEDKVHLGIKVREANGELVLRTPEDREVTVPVKDIAERGNSRSLMPDGLADTLTRQEFADLVRFLSELGKVGGPYAPSKARVVRRWQVIEPTQPNMNLFRRNRVAAATEPDQPFVWSPVYSRVPGELPLAELPKAVVWQNADPLTVVRFHLDATAPGAARLRFNSPAGLALYHGTTPIDVKPETPLDVKPGVQTLTLVIDRTKRTDDVRVELDDVPGSPARVSVVGGK